MACEASSADGPFNCTLNLSDGSILNYVSFLVNAIYPEGLGCDPTTGQLYAFDANLNAVNLPAIVDLQTGQILPAASNGLAPPSALTVTEVL